MKRVQGDIRPDSAGTTGCLVQRSATDPYEREDHRDLNADCEQLKHVRTGRWRRFSKTSLFSKATSG